MERGPCTILSPVQSLWVKLEGDVYLCEGTQKLASVFYHLIPSSLLLTLIIYLQAGKRLVQYSKRGVGGITGEGILPENRV